MKKICKVFDNSTSLNYSRQGKILIKYLSKNFDQVASSDID